MSMLMNYIVFVRGPMIEILDPPLKQTWANVLECLTLMLKVRRSESHKSRRPSACLLLQFPETLNVGTSQLPSTSCGMWSR